MNKDAPLYRLYKHEQAVIEDDCGPCNLTGQGSGAPLRAGAGVHGQRESERAVDRYSGVGLFGLTWMKSGQSESSFQLSRTRSIESPEIVT